MARSALSSPVRHAILDLAPLELDCMTALWPLGEATVRDIRQALVLRRPRAYTTIMTVMDRLAQKGVVVRRKKGRAWVYHPNLSLEEARSHAIARVVQGFFEGSREAFVEHLSAQGSSLAAGETVPGQESCSSPSRLQTAADRGPSKTAAHPGDEGKSPGPGAIPA